MYSTFSSQFVLWVDADLVSYPKDIIQSLIGSGKQIVTPHCVMEPGGRSYDLNSWRVKNEKLGEANVMVVYHFLNG